MFIHVISWTKPFCLPKSETGGWEAPLTVGKMQVSKVIKIRMESLQKKKKKKTERDQ